MNAYTELENKVINTFVTGGFSFFDEGAIEGSSSWSGCFVEECGDPKIYRGVVSSLIKKGFLDISDWKEDGEHAIYLTKLAEQEIASRKEGIA